MKSNTNASLEYWSAPNKWFLDAYDDSLLQKIIHGPLKLRVELAIAATKISSAKKVLDLGCGPSRVIHRCLSETNVESAIGLDFSKRMLSESSEYLTKKNVIDKVELIQCDLLDIDKYPTADIAIALGLFDYISNPELVIRQTHASCKYMVSSWVRPSPRNFARRFRYSCDIFTHTENDVRKFFYNSGINSLFFIELGPMCGFVTISTKD